MPSAHPICSSTAAIDGVRTRRTISGAWSSTLGTHQTIAYAVAGSEADYPDDAECNLDKADKAYHEERGEALRFSTMYVLANGLASCRGLFSASASVVLFGIRSVSSACCGAMTHHLLVSFSFLRRMYYDAFSKPHSSERLPTAAAWRSSSLNIIWLHDCAAIHTLQGLDARRMHVSLTQQPVRQRSITAASRWRSCSGPNGSADRQRAPVPVPLPAPPPCLFLPSFQPARQKKKKKNNGHGNTLASPSSCFALSLTIVDSYCARLAFLSHHPIRSSVQSVAVTCTPQHVFLLPTHPIPPQHIWWTWTCVVVGACPAAGRPLTRQNRRSRRNFNPKRKTWREDSFSLIMKRIGETMRRSPRRRKGNDKALNHREKV